jgi:hypothetical protein
MKRLFALGLAIPLFAAVAASAQNPPEPANGGNLPGLGEIMTLQQLRHIKLWFAGRAGNWALADYEMGELNEGFEDVDKLLGGDTVQAMVGDPIKALQKAIEGKNRAAFTSAFDKLSTGCNNCHRTLDHGFIVIQRPALLPYSDQAFEPPKQ